MCCNASAKNIHSCNTGPRLYLRGVVPVSTNCAHFRRLPTYHASSICCRTSEKHDSECYIRELSRSGCQNVIEDISKQGSAIAGLTVSGRCDFSSSRTRARVLKNMRAESLSAKLTRRPNFLMREKLLSNTPEPKFCLLQSSEKDLHRSRSTSTCRAWASRFQPTPLITSSSTIHRHKVSSQAIGNKDLSSSSIDRASARHHGISHLGSRVEPSHRPSQLASFTPQSQHPLLQPCILLILGTRLELQLKTWLCCRAT